MSKRLLMAGFILAMAVALVASAAAAKGKPSSAALRVQKSLSVSINKTTGYVIVSNYYIKRGGKKVAVKPPAYVVTRSDSSGNACGSKQTGSGPKLKLQVPGMIKAVVTLRSKLKYNGKYLTITKMASADFGSDQVQCNALGATPPASSICAWNLPPANPDPSQFYCGLPIAKAPAFITSISMTDNVVSMGKIGDPARFCQQKLTPVKGMWLGSPVQDIEWDCADPVAVVPRVTIWLKPPNSEQRCSETGAIGGQLQSFTIPPTWGGTLYVSYRITMGWGQHYLGVEYETATFTLNGSDNGCSQLQDGPTG